MRSKTFSIGQILQLNNSFKRSVGELFLFLMSYCAELNGETLHLMYILKEV